MTTELAQAPWNGKVFVGGEFRDAVSGEARPVLEKATQEPLGQAGLGSPEDVDLAVGAARAVQPAWAAEGHDVRSAALRRMVAVMERRAGEIADAVVRETGGIRGKADYEVHASISELHEAAALTTRALGEILPAHNPGKFSMSRRVPVGVVGAITPWNFPLLLGMRCIAPALALGNAVVLKPSPETPITGGLLIADLFAEAELPAGLFSVVPGDQEVGEALVEHPGIGMVHFTGSSPVGRRIAEVGGRLLKRVSLELGGNNALIVLEDADIEAATMVGAWSSFHYSGQTCISAGRHIVRREILDAYVERLAERARAVVVGDPAAGSVGLGCLINERQRARAQDLLERSLAAGARVVEGGRSDGLFYRPSVVVDLKPDMPLWTEEVFAPIAPVMAVESDEEAIALTNASEYGLVNAVYTGNPDRGLALAERLRSGMTHVNDSTVLDEPHVPFGGVGASGYGGRLGGEANLDEFTERQWISVQRTPVQYPY